MVNNDDDLVDPSPQIHNGNVNPLTLYGAICANHHLIWGIAGFTVAEIVAAYRGAPELALPLIGWAVMVVVVSGVVCYEKSTCSVKQTGEDQSPSQTFYQVLKPFVCVFLPFIGAGLTVMPLIFSKLLPDNNQTQSWLPLAEDSVGLIAALCGLYIITPKEDWIQQRNHLLVTITGFMIVGIIIAICEICDAYIHPVSRHDARSPEQWVLPLSSALAVLCAVTMTILQSRSYVCNTLTNLCQGIFASTSNVRDTLTESLLPSGQQSNA